MRGGSDDRCSSSRAFLAAALTASACVSHVGVTALRQPLTEQVLFSSDYQQGADEQGHRLGAPGYDVVWLGHRGPHYAGLAERAAFIVDPDGLALGGTDFSALRPLGFSVRDASWIGSDRHALYWFASGPALWRGAPGSMPERLWAGAGDLDKVRQDDGSVYALFIECRTCVPIRSEEIWRFPKAGGPPTRLFRTSQDELVVEFLTDGTSLVVSLAGANARVLRVPVGGGPPSVVEAEAAELLDVDDHHFYLSTSEGLVREPRGGGPRTVMKKEQTSRDKLTDDGHDFFFLDGTELTAAPMGGGALRLLADFGRSSGESSPYCYFCGHSATSVCVRCADTEVYRVPKAPRPAALMLASDSGSALAVSDDAFFSDDDSTVSVRKRSAVEGETCTKTPDWEPGAPPILPSCNSAIARDESRSALASPLIADARFLYYALEDGSVHRARQTQGPVETVAPATPRGASARSKRTPTPRSLVVGADPVTWVDTARGAVLRAPKAGGAIAVVKAGLDAPVALVQQGASLVVVSATAKADDAGNDTDWRATSLDAGFTEIGRVHLASAEQPDDVAMTDEAVYVVFPAGLARIVRKDGSCSMLFPDLAPRNLAADAHSLYFSDSGRVMALADGAAWPTVLASGLDATPGTLVRFGDSLYFTAPRTFKWMHWAPLGAIPVTPQAP